MVKQILEEGEEITDEFKKEMAPQESGEFILEFAQKIGEIKKDEDEALHVFTQNVRFY